ncbi:MAG: hypothetical protein HYS59_00405 [Candidatus Vogelbacteria bacterium]|nr:hypothetical protein [Candidatus Vogelbacteria bacterium]
MAQRTFQTTFIPRGNLSGVAPAGQGRRRTINVLLVIGVVSFLVSVAGYAGAIIYSGIARTSIEQLGTSLQRARDAFDPNLLFELDRVDRKVEAGKLVLADHVTLLPLFAVLDQSTLKAVRFNSFTYAQQGNADARIDLSGHASSFATVALQSDAFVETKRLRNVVFSDLTVTPTGSVNFRMSATVDPALLSYKRNVAVSK